MELHLFKQILLPELGLLLVMTVEDRVELL